VRYNLENFARVASGPTGGYWESVG